MANARSLIAKVRKAVHSVHPRELSPTRMAEKYGADQKKKGKAKLQTIADANAAQKVQAEEMLQAQMSVLDAAMPKTSLAMQSFTPLVSAPKSVPVAPARNWWPWIIGGAGAVALAVFVGKRP